MPKILGFIILLGVLLIGGSYLTHVWLEQTNLLFPLFLPLLIAAICAVGAKLRRASQHNTLTLYGSYGGVFILMLGAWVLFLHGQLVSGLEISLTTLIVLIVLLVMYQFS